MWRTKERPPAQCRGSFQFHHWGVKLAKTYCRPLKRGASWRSQNFGDNKTIYGPHTGNDEACNSGTPVHAAGDGVIEWAGEFDDTYADNLLWLLRMGGNVAVLNCGSDEPTFVYAHLKTFYVRPGDRVKKGQVIALSGNSGTATTGPHLHVECIPPGYVLNSPLLGRVNPDLYLTEWPEDVIAIAPQSVEIEDEEMAKAEVAALKADLHTVHMAVLDAAASIKADIHTVHLATLNNKPNASAAEFAEAIVGKLGSEFAKTVVAEIGVRITQ